MKDDLKLEVGKTYRSRNGTKVKIIEKISDSSYLFCGDNDKYYNTTGNYSASIPSDEDLIEEYEEKNTTVPKFKHGKKYFKKDGWNPYVYLGTSDELGLKTDDIYYMFLNKLGSAYKAEKWELENFKEQLFEHEEIGYINVNTYNPSEEGYLMNTRCLFSKENNYANNNERIKVKVTYKQIPEDDENSDRYAWFSFL